jgi:hypothetical protein
LIEIPMLYPQLLEVLRYSSRARSSSSMTRRVIPARVEMKTRCSREIAPIRAG